VSARVRSFRGKRWTKWDVKIDRRPVGSWPRARCLTCSLAYSVQRSVSAAERPNENAILVIYKMALGGWIGDRSRADQPTRRKAAHRARFVLDRALESIGLRSPTEIGLPLGLGLQGKTTNRALTWTRTPEPKGKSDSHLDSDSGVQRQIGLFLGLGLWSPKANRALTWTRALESNGNRALNWTRTLGAALTRRILAGGVAVSPAFRAQLPR
jgi:hypothetical protein